MQQKNIIIDNLKVNYLSSDSLEAEKTLIFLHGWKSEARHLKIILDQCENYIALDLPGFGSSDQPKTAWSLDKYAEFLKRFLEKLGISNPILIGHSFGGSIVIKYCSAGYSAQKIILIDSAGIRETGIKIVIYKYLAKIVKIFLSLPGISHFKDTIRKKVYKAIDSEDYLQAGDMLEIYRKTIGEDLQSEMPKLKLATILIWGKEDTATPLKNAERMKELIPNSKVFVIENAGHFPFIDQPDEFIRIFNNALS